jgi:hypothetical protein
MADVACRAGALDDFVAAYDDRCRTIGSTGIEEITAR